jgi:hypothetical protein
LGTNNSIYCISLVVSGPSEFRDYPTLLEASKTLETVFNIKDVIPVSLKVFKPNLIEQFILKFEKVLRTSKPRLHIYRRHLRIADLDNVHQLMYVLTPKHS